ncbi:MAG: hypothetical protein ACK4N5_01175 [Myxococcales bacterium]
MTSLPAIRTALLAPLLALAACAPRLQPVVLKMDTRTLGGTQADATIQVPSDWYELRRTPERVEFLGPDNFSRIIFMSQPMTTPATHCESLLQAALQKFKNEQARSPAVALETQPVQEALRPSYDFRMTAPGTPPGPRDRVYFGRASCDEGGIGVVGCYVGKNRADSLGGTCQKVAASLTVIPAGLVQEPATTTTPPSDQPHHQLPSGGAPVEKPQADPMPNEMPAAEQPTPPPGANEPQPPGTGGPQPKQ